MNSEKLIQKMLDDDAEVRLVLEIASRARDIEARELPRELGTATEVVAIPTNPQCAV